MIVNGALERLGNWGVDWSGYATVENLQAVSNSVLELKTNLESNYVTETTISEENDWTYEFNDLFKYENGQIIEYKIVEDEVKGYISSYETIVNNDNKTEIIITNSHENETIDLEINKIWDDKQNIYNTRPDHINVDLYENGILLDNLIITKESDWKLILNGLQKYKNGEAYL